MKKFITLKYFRFGITQSVASLVPIKKDEEFFVSYNYQMDVHKHSIFTTPKWYRQLYKKFVTENPSQADEKYLKNIEEIDKDVANIQHIKLILTTVNRLVNLLSGSLASYTFNMYQLT